MLIYLFYEKERNNEKQAEHSPLTSHTASFSRVKIIFNKSGIAFYFFSSSNFVIVGVGR